MNIHIDFFGPWHNKLGESPVWDADLEVLYWVDTIAPRVCRASSSAEEFRTWAMPDLVGSIALADGGLVAALRDGFYFVDTVADSAVTAIARPEQGNTSVRFNDGKADRQGRFLAGTMRTADCTGAPGTVYRLDPDGSCSVLERGLAVSNAVCFSPAGEQLYLADSLQSLIWRYDYEVTTGTVSGRRPFIDTRPFGSVPDGATVDAKGDLWIALFQTQQIAHCDPNGELLRLIDLPVPFPSCPAFGGNNMQTLFVTTISDSGHRVRSDHPGAGRMLMIEGLDACGLPETRCRLRS